MEISVNGKPMTVAEGTTAAGLVAVLELGGRRYAMEINGEIVPKSTHSERRLEAGDRVEIVHAVGGG
jgi:sulfur carrier protein